MKLLLDTCTFLWIVADSPMLSAAARAAAADPANDVYLSAASAWEIAVKHALGRLPLPDRVELFVPGRRQSCGIEPWPVSEEAALHVAKLPKLHSDPFDRMLVAQALTERATLVSHDHALEPYGVKTIWT